MWLKAPNIEVSLTNEFFIMFGFAENEEAESYRQAARNALLAKDRFGQSIWHSAQKATRR